MGLPGLLLSSRELIDEGVRARMARPCPSRAVPPINLRALMVPCTSACPPSAARASIPCFGAVTANFINP